MSWYKTGTISLTNGSVDVIGTGTLFNRYVDSGEGLIAPDGQCYEVASVVSDTLLRLAKPYLGETVTTAPYSIVPVQGYVRTLAREAADLIDAYRAIPVETAAAAEAAQAASTSANSAASTASAAAATASVAATTATASASSAAASSSLSEDKAEEALNSAAAAAASADVSAQAASAAVAARDSATSAAATADTSATTAVAAAASATANATNSTSAALDADSSASAATSAAATASAAADAAAASAAAALEDATLANTAASAAQLSAVNATTSETTAAAAATVATTSASSANAFASAAQEWATKTSSEVVVGQGFGAKKYAQDAAASAASAATADISAVAAADVATTKANEAVVAAAAAGESAIAAGTSEVNAVNASTIATTKAGEATAAASAAAGSAASALSATADAVAAKNKAEQWADAESGSEVEPGRYSAKHWALLAQSSATGALVYVGTFDASENGIPAASAVGSFYKISAAGSVGGTLPVSVGDEIYFDGTQWDKAGSLGSVMSVAGRTGDITLTATDVGLGNVQNVDQTNASNLASGLVPTARLPDATTAVKGVVQLNDTLTSSSTTQALTAAQGKALQDGKLAKFTESTTAVSKTLAVRERCSVTAAGQTITLPPSPTAGDEVCVSVGNFADTTVAGNGSQIRTPNGDDASAIINKAYATVGFYFDGTHWRVF